MQKLKMHTPDITDQNVEKIAALFPSCVTETRQKSGGVTHAIDFDQLRQELSKLPIVDGLKERYQLNWPGKHEALIHANTPILKTLRPNIEESVDFDNTKNLFIEGDNLDALKLLQETYLNKVKMIYIDPPYNTGHDFIYNDDFREAKEAYLNNSQQVDEHGNRMQENLESNGRFHSAWLSMMYSRLRLARNLLKDDGVIFISIDDHEVHNLRKICDEIFGMDNFIGQLIWKSRQNKDNRNITGLSIDHEYILCFSKINNRRIFKGTQRQIAQYKNPDQDSRGSWVSANMVGLLPEDQRPNCHYDLINPKTKINYGKPKMGWRYEQTTMNRLISEDRIIWPEKSNGRPRRKVFLNELNDELPNFTSIIGEDIFTHLGTKEINNLFGDKYFDFPKPSDLLITLIEQVSSSNNNDLILDFFAGSATTAHAVMAVNAEDSGNRRYIMVQLPEICAAKSLAYKSGHKTITEISKERIRRAGKKIKEEKNIEHLDIGFRVLKIDSSNMKDIYYEPKVITQSNLLAQVDSVQEGRSPSDLLFQVLLDLGIDLALPITQKKIFGKKVFFINQDAMNALAACFDINISEDLVKELATYKPRWVVFRDSGFKSDSLKINIEQIFKHLSPDTEIRVL